ncbi:hypothetical protein FLM48_18075 [Shewanella sp. Scap07]|uniref:hypothetical protein n=1 Tax=Shewanella sp. Scap07 TaxID=2589987 RepID=UPI0015BCC5A1|nr:hypothetical protein [Shewanella sp. Scap07]QLE86806.1 hypothetical protein FLM48_18055 [Shewanella sp. Scap07]QLE86810.1 hypothetical protein FLM48_18075 [Shewanella sp. Scap07]
MKESDTESDVIATEAIEEALDDGNKVQYLHIETPIIKTDRGSAVSEVKISEFEIDATQLAG